ncbi:N-acetylgalactosaminyltransferase 4-like [Chironomus tepperi]|uniref:N-acetylgalactosaminyltransferase 4-like n=1 Tax=Chironomus tepperi TaxID=113505 RepID=UPI00391FC0D3
MGTSCDNLYLSGNYGNNPNKKRMFSNLNGNEILWIVFAAALMTLFFDLPFGNLKKLVFDSKRPQVQPVRQQDKVNETLTNGHLDMNANIISDYNKKSESYSDTQISTLKTEVLLYREAYGSLRKKIAKPRYPFATQYDKVDYHDYEFMEYEASRTGPGEQGKAYVLKDESYIEKNEEIFQKFGFYGIASDHISVNRSLPDIRHEKCRRKQYLRQIPKVSIIIVYFDEYLSMLKRTLHSIYNRTPHMLIHEIILVNDNSTLDELYQPFVDYVKMNFGEIVKFIMSNERRGMIGSRLDAARFATGEVLPIALNPKVITTPIIDSFRYDTFEFKKLDDGGRGIFNWDLQYRRVPRRPEDIRPDAPIPSPVMIGSVFAMNRQFFWDIGAYDKQLKVSHGEQFEMSFKAHLCAHGVFECPCSRVAHSYRYKNYYKRFENGTDFAARNMKRIAEVWMDEYKEIVYKRNPSKYMSLDPGNLSRENIIRQGLHCKPFRYFIEYVAPELLERYPIIDPGYFAKGTIRSKANPKLCVEVFKDNTENTKDMPITRKIILNKCDDNHVNPSPRQSFTLTWNRNIQNSIYDYCIQNSLTIVECHFRGGNQLWRFDLVSIK